MQFNRGMYDIWTVNHGYLICIYSGVTGLLELQGSVPVHKSSAAATAAPMAPGALSKRPSKAIIVQDEMPEDAGTKGGCC